MPNLFRSQRKGVEYGPYKFMDEKGKIVTCGTDDKDLAKSFMESKGLQVTGTSSASFADLASALASPTPSLSPTPTATIPSTTSIKPDGIIPTVQQAPSEKSEKPKPGSIRKNGLAELAPHKITKLKEALGGIVASGNIDAIRLVYSLINMDTAELDPNGQALLGLGWEAQLEELFVGGLPPPWLILIIANITLMVKVGLSAKAKNATPTVEVKTIGQQTDNK